MSLGAGEVQGHVRSTAKLSPTNRACPRPSFLPYHPIPTLTGQSALAISSVLLSNRRPMPFSMVINLLWFGCSSFFRV